MKTRWMLGVTVLVVAGLIGIGAAEAPKITVSNVDNVLASDPLGDKPVKFSPGAKIANVGILVGQIKKIRLHTHAQEDHVVYVIRGRAVAKLGDETREVGPGDLIAIPKLAPHSFEQKGSEPFVILVNSTPGWDPLRDTTFLDK